MKTIRLLFLLFLLTALTACGGSEPPAPPEGPETVSLTVWGAEEDQELLQEIQFPDYLPASERVKL